ncbi:N-acetyltransferase, partial [Levilactobacillus brevis]|nr:N-acetyltransferase [Levilactobacillus brevis]
TALTWGIERRQTHKLIGWGGFTHLDLNTRTSQLAIQGRRLTAAEQQEIIDRLVHFGQDELQLKTMTLNQSAHVEPAVLAAAGFTTQNNDWIWQQH